MKKGKILFSKKSNICFLKFVGELRYDSSSGFDCLVRRELENKQIVNFVLDFKEAEYLDSTNLGIMGMIASGMKNKSPKKPVIVGPQKDLLTIISSMGFDILFEILDDWDSGELKYQDTSTINVKKRKTNELVLESHKTLAEMSKYNKEKFTSVIEAIIKNKK